MKLTYKVTRMPAPVYVYEPLTAKTVIANADRIAEWINAQKQQRVEIARLGGAATKGISTAAKRRAARLNGAKGGRPRKGFSHELAKEGSTNVAPALVPSPILKPMVPPVIDINFPQKRKRKDRR